MLPVPAVLFPFLPWLGILWCYGAGRGSRMSPLFLCVAFPLGHSCYYNTNSPPTLSVPGHLMLALGRGSCECWGFSVEVGFLGSPFWIFLWPLCLSLWWSSIPVAFGAGVPSRVACRMATLGSFSPRSIWPTGTSCSSFSLSHYRHLNCSTTTSLLCSQALFLSSGQSLYKPTCSYEVNSIHPSGWLNLLRLNLTGL